MSGDYPEQNSAGMTGDLSDGDAPDEYLELGGICPKRDGALYRRSAVLDVSQR